MRFAQPEMLWLLLAVPLLIFAGWFAATRRRRTLERFASSPEVAQIRAEVNPHLRAGKALLLLLALSASIVALARPQWGTRLERIERSGADIVIVLDRSLSMAAEDVAPNRFELARHRVGKLLARWSGDRIALVEFSGTASLACPLTLDHSAVQLFLSALDVESVAVPGSALAAALDVAISALDDRSENESDRSRAIVLFSDGEDHEGGMDKTLERLKDAGIAVYSVGTGTRRGAPIPLVGPTGAALGYKKDGEGKIVTTRLDETLLESLARDTEGQYHRASARGTELDRITEAVQAMERGALDETLRVRYEERYQWPLAIGLLALLTETLLGDRRKGVWLGPVSDGGTT